MPAYERPCLFNSGVCLLLSQVFMPRERLDLCKAAALAWVPSLVAARVVVKAVLIFLDFAVPEQYALAPSVELVPCAELWAV